MTEFVDKVNEMTMKAATEGEEVAKLFADLLAVAIAAARVSGASFEDIEWSVAECIVQAKRHEVRESKKKLH